MRTKATDCDDAHRAHLGMTPNGGDQGPSRHFPSTDYVGGGASIALSLLEGRRSLRGPRAIDELPAEVDIWGGPLTMKGEPVGRDPGDAPHRPPPSGPSS